MKNQNQNEVEEYNDDVFTTEFQPGKVFRSGRKRIAKKQKELPTVEGMLTQVLLERRDAIVGALKKLEDEPDKYLAAIAKLVPLIANKKESSSDNGGMAPADEPVEFYMQVTHDEAND